MNFEFLRSFAHLERLSYEVDTGGAPSQSTEQFWHDYSNQGWLHRLLASGHDPKVFRRLSNGTWEVSLMDASISDLTILQGAPISELGLNNTRVSDLTPLRGMPLRKLFLDRTLVTDLGPLKGMQLESLHLNRTAVTNLEPIRNLTLVSLRLSGCQEITDLSPLYGLTNLQRLVLPPNATNIAFLRSFPKLEQLSYRMDPYNAVPRQSAAEFRAEQDDDTVDAKGRKVVQE